MADRSNFFIAVGWIVGGLRWRWGEEKSLIDNDFDGTQDALNAVGTFGADA